MAWLLREDIAGVDSFFANLRVQDVLVAPQLLRPECTSVIREQTFGGRITPEEATQLVEVLGDLVLRVNTSVQQFSRALDLAERFRHAKAYDAQYLAVAEMENAELVTIDQSLRHAAKEIGVAVRWLA